MDDDSLVELSFSIDKILETILDDFGGDALSLSAIIIARLHHLTLGYGCNEDFKTLLEHASKQEFHKKDKPNIRLVVNNDGTE